MKMTRLTLSLAITVVMAVSLSAQNVVVQWNAIASTTIVTNAKEASVASGVWFAYVHLAMFDAQRSEACAYPARWTSVRAHGSGKTLDRLTDTQALAFGG